MYIVDAARALGARGRSIARSQSGQLTSSVLTIVTVLALCAVLMFLVFQRVFGATG